MKEPFYYEGVPYYDVKTFAYEADRTTQTIYRLKDKGNAIRKLKQRTINGKPMIPVSELTEFPVCDPGVNGALNITHFKEIKDGEAR